MRQPFSDKFLIRIFEAFHMIETLVIDQDESRWSVENLLSVLQSLLSIKNLTFSNHITLMDSNFSLVETKVIFEAAFDLMKHFPNLNYYLSFDVCACFRPSVLQSFRPSVCPKKNFLMVADIKKCQYKKLSHF